MSKLLDLISLAVQLDDPTPAGLIETCTSQGAICPASAFSPIAAAFATQGYYVQSDLLYFLTATSFGIWAPLLYLCAAAGGIISLAMGMPPRMYLWFFVGPGLYSWLLETRFPVHGVQWQVAGINQDQREVWRLAEVGLRNLPIQRRLAGDSADGSLPFEGSNIEPSMCSPTLDPVYVSNFFIWYDEVISATVQWLIDWTGIYSQQEGLEGAETGILPLPDGSNGQGRWYLISNQKWELLDTITSARLSNSDLRDSFITFLSSECGDGLKESVDARMFASAANSENGRVPCTVMLHTNSADLATENGGLCLGVDGPAGAFKQDEYSLLRDALRVHSVPIPTSARRLVQDEAIGSFLYFLDGGPEALVSDGIKDFFRYQDEIECQQLFYIVMQGFRWEASLAYHQLVANAPFGMSGQDLLYSLFYGWNVRAEVGGELLTPAELKDWTINLIFIHLLRNELAITQRVADPKYSNGQTMQNYSNTYIAQTGSKGKYGEVYAWARMIPYIQGVLMYLLAMAYPFACIMIVVPGWHKILFTWMSFWAWVKLWDVGFAIVVVVERSIWSMLGSNTTLAYLSPMIQTMTAWGATNIPECEAVARAQVACGLTVNPEAIDACPVIPNLTDNVLGGIGWSDLAAFFDRALLLSTSLDIDVANGYYIYLMSALYFAVPAATGQLVLGARSGVAGMVNNFSQGAQSDSARGATSGFQGNLRGNVTQGAAVGRQQTAGKSMRQGGLIDKALSQANTGLDAGLMGGMYDTAKQQTGLMNANAGATNSVIGARQQAASSISAWNHARGAVPETAQDWVTAPTTSKLPTGMYGLPAWGSDRLSAMSGGRGSSAPAGTGSGPSGTGAGFWNTIASPFSWALGKANTAAGFADRVGQTANPFFSPLAQFQSSAAQMAYARAGEGFASAYGRTQAALNGSNSELNMAGFGVSSQREALGTGERRYGGLADFRAQEAVHGFNVGASDSAGGHIGALGLDASILNTTGLPMDGMSFAVAGRLGGGTATKANYAMTGFWGNRAAAMGSLQQKYGTGQVNNYWKGDSPVLDARSIANFGNRAYNSMRAQGGTASPSWNFDPSKK